MTIDDVIHLVSDGCSVIVDARNVPASKLQELATQAARNHASVTLRNARDIDIETVRSLVVLAEGTLTLDFCGD